MDFIRPGRRAKQATGRMTAFQSLLLCLLVAMAIAPLNAAEIPIELDPDSRNDLAIELLPDGGYDITTTGGEPVVASRPLAVAYDPRQQYVLSFDYFCAEGLDHLELFFGPPFRAGLSAHGGPVLSSEGWTSYSVSIKSAQQPGTWRAGYKQFRLDLGRQGGRRIRIRNLRLRPPDVSELKLEREGDARRQRTAEDLPTE